MRTTPRTRLHRSAFTRSRRIQPFRSVEPREQLAERRLGLDRGADTADTNDRCSEQSGKHENRCAHLNLPLNEEGDTTMTRYAFARVPEVAVRGGAKRGLDPAPQQATLPASTDTPGYNPCATTPGPYRSCFKHARSLEPQAIREKLVAECCPRSRFRGGVEVIEIKSEAVGQSAQPAFEKILIGRFA
jgi:hypothetical protein